jgi:hypothetical protein
MIRNVAVSGSINVSSIGSTPGSRPSSKLGIWVWENPVMAVEPGLIMGTSCAFKVECEKATNPVKSAVVAIKLRWRFNVDLLEFIEVLIAIPFIHSGMRKCAQAFCLRPDQNPVGNEYVNWRDWSVQIVTDT